MAGANVLAWHGSGNLASELIEELRLAEVEVISIADGFSLDGPAAEVILAVMSWAAKMERLAINERIAAARAFEAVVFEEQENAAKVKPVLEKVLAEAWTGRVQSVIVWALDRLLRSLHSAINTVL
jgi:DNA invertase Pin-like site-specific DNA recombinase